MYKYLLFDADNTLLDFDKSEASALEMALNQFPIGFNEEIRNVYHEININEWKKLERNETTREKLKVDRFNRLYLHFGLFDQSLGEKTARVYEKSLSNFGYLIEGADKLLEQLSKSYEIYVVTNGSTEIQVPRMKKSGLNKYIKHTFISEELGVTKPDSRFFEIVLSFIGDKDRSNYLLIGDSISSDITGAVDFGIDSVFYSPNGIECPQANYVINKLEEIYNIL